MNQTLKWLRVVVPGGRYFPTRNTLVRRACESVGCRRVLSPDLQAQQVGTGAAAGLVTTLGSPGVGSIHGRSLCSGGVCTRSSTPLRSLTPACVHHWPRRGLVGTWSRFLHPFSCRTRGALKVRGGETSAGPSRVLRGSEGWREAHFQRCLSENVLVLNLRACLMQPDQLRQLLLR